MDTQLVHNVHLIRSETFLLVSTRTSCLMLFRPLRTPA